ncbi:hypothetical protein H7U19_05545 [Hyunsoonleella sp. SJ7]|uniref:Uncharacterized protein n=1 Tax=Hyunsoonleella aquatilis TaxID=2762758 RepID=A0A923HAX7_9FLAO|nr:hypothetical protein [Hyunsoonleella aquatilis]MBC3757859.1 hypothetical protein [Hyunsoonleella aquatilis]
MKRINIKTAGIINLLGAILHTVGGQIELVNPLLESDISIQQKSELTGAWHIVTILLFLTSYIILKVGFKKDSHQEKEFLKPIAVLYILSGIPFLITSFLYKVNAFQWILLMPIGILILMGLQKPSSNRQNL